MARISFDGEIPRVNIRLPSGDAEALTRFVRELVRIPSPSTQEGPLAARVAEEMRRVGFADVWVSRIGSVIGTSDRARPKLLLDGHMDTVDVGDPARWPTSPYGGQIENGILYAAAPAT